MDRVFVHERALCESRQVGPGTRVWAFAHVLPGARIGVDCNICDGVFIENEVVIGDRVTLKSGVQVWDGITLEDDVFVGPNATFTNDLRPRSKAYQEKVLRTVVRRGASIGANATILPGIEIGEGAMIGAGAVVTRSVPPGATVVGNPARIIRSMSDDGPAARPGILPPPESDRAKAINTGVRGVRLVRLPQFPDVRVGLSVGASEQSMPFAPKRFFLVRGVPSRETCGHAHRTCHQLLLCVAGTCTVLVDDGSARCEFVLDDPSTGLHVPPMVWAARCDASEDAVLLVLASELSDPADDIHDHAFRVLAGSGTPP